MTSIDPVGFVCGTKGDSVSFLVNKDVCLSFGQIVRIASSERDFYARVVNSKSSSTLELIEQLREAEGKEAFGPYSAYRSVDAILFLEKRFLPVQRYLLKMIFCAWRKAIPETSHMLWQLTLVQIQFRHPLLTFLLEKKLQWLQIQIHR